MSRTDEELLVAWRNGDRDAGDDLLSRYFDAVYRFFRSKIKEGVEDLVQRTFLDCVEARDRVEGTTFRGYLFRVARNRLVDHLRRGMRMSPHVDITDQPLVSLDTTPSQIVARNQDEHYLLEAMRRLPLDLQITLELCYWEDLTGREIAEALAIPSNTVRSRLVRARAKLKSELEVLTASPALAQSTLRALDERISKIS